MNSVTFYIPSRTKDGNYIYGTQKDITRYIAGIFAVKFGGATVTEGTGFYQDNAKNMIEEPVKLVQSFFEVMPENHYFEILADNVKSAMKQESVLFTINNQPTFI